MPNIKSAKKRVLSNKKKEFSNNQLSTKTRTSIKAVNKDLAAGNKEDANNKLNVAIKNIDKSAKAGLIHKNKQARLKSKLMKSLNEERK